MSSIPITPAKLKPISFSGHWLFPAFMACSIYPLFRAADLPFRLDFFGMASAYWWATASRALFLAIAFSIIAFPKSTLFPALARYRTNLIRLPFLFALAIFLIFVLGVQVGLMMLVVAVGAAELLDQSPALVGKRVLDAVLPAAYLFLGLLLIFSLNHAIAGLKFAGAWDGFYNRLDAQIFRLTAAQFSEWSRVHLPVLFWKLSVLAYYNVYGQIGAVMVILALHDGRARSVQFVGALLTAYALALVCFYLTPTMGPFALAQPNLFDWLSTTAFVQKVLPIRAALLWKHAAVPELYTVQIADYYIGFPSMHVAMPVIALWFCRKWRLLFGTLFLFDVFLVLGIVLLQWHYLMDIVGGVAVALLGIWLATRTIGAKAVVPALDPG